MEPHKKNQRLTGRLYNGTTGSMTSTYLDNLRQKTLLLLALICLMVIVALYAVTQGAYDIAVKDLVRALVGHCEGTSRIVIANIRLPRIAAAVICGGGLSLAGLGIQSLLKNPLGSPSTLGISQGAAFGAALSIVIFGGRLLTTTAFAFGGAVAATLVILVLAKINKLSAEAIILAGVAMSSLFASGTTLIQYLATETQLAMVVFWAFGDVTRSSWREIALVAISVLLYSIYLMLNRWDLNALLSGEETAKGLGVSVEKVRMAGMMMAAVVSALATAFHGVIAFIGLLAPHMARRLVGDDHLMLIPFTFVLGALLLLAADTLGRVLMGSGALPVGVITSFLGAPMFLYLLVRGYR